MEVSLLGPLEITGPQGRVHIGGAKERLVLALLALRAGEVISRDALVDALWGEDPPATAVKTMQGYVARVRRALEAAGLADALATRHPGYVLCPPSEPTDVVRFEAHATAGRDALHRGNPLPARSELTEGLALWRGDALVDCRGGGWARTEAMRLDELRLSAIEDQIDADLMLGRHAAAVGSLEALVTQHPMRERLWAALMLALYRSGRQADAMRAYQRARRTLVEELGLEPGAELRRLEAAVLIGDPSLDAPAPARRGTVDDATPLIPLPRRVHRAAPATLIGRAQEHSALHRSLERVCDGEQRVVLLSGEPGIGKTSLSATFAREASLVPATVLYGRCNEDLGIPYEPWVEALAHLVDHAPNDLLEAHVAARGPQLSRLVPGLTRRVAVAHHLSADTEADRYLLFGAVVDLLVRVAEQAPIVLVLDDLHWADPPTLQLLRHVVATDTPLRLLVIGTFRDTDVDDRHPLRAVLAAMHRELSVERLVLRGLTDDELLALIETSSGPALLDDGPALRDALSAETDGNPFFVGELLRHLAETRVLHGEELERPGTAEPAISDLPVSIREVIGERVARLGAESQRVLSLAAVMGREFDGAMLAIVAEIDDDALVDICDGAVLAALLAEGDATGRYTFRHALIEHALYDRLPAGRRGRAHRAVASALEAYCGDDPAERIGELAYHWARATPRTNAAVSISYAQRAGDRALAQLAPDEALRWYQDALDQLDGSGLDDDARRAALLLGVGDAQRQIGDPAHRETLLTAGRLADDIGAVDILARAALTNNRGWNSIVGGVDHDRVTMLRRTLDRLGDADSPDRARLLALLCVEVTWEQDFDERLSMAREAVDIARRLKDDAALVDAIRHSHESITMPQTLELRRRWIAEACDLAEELGDPTALRIANDHQMYAALEAGDMATVDGARSIFEAISERIGQPLNRWQLAYHSAWQLALDGDLDAALEVASDGLALGTAAGQPDDALTIYRFQIMSLRYMQGRLPRRSRTLSNPPPMGPGLDIYRVTTAFMTSLGESPHEVAPLLDAEVANDFPMFPDATWLVAHVLWAEAAARTGHRPASTLLYGRLLPWHDQFATTHISVHGGVAHYLGLLAHALDLHDEGDKWFEQALALHESMRAPFFIAWTQVAWAALLTERARPGDDQRATALAEDALRVASRRGYGYVECDARSILE